MTKSLRRKGFRQKNRKSRKQRVSRKRQMKGGYLADLDQPTLNNPLIMLGLSPEFLGAMGKTLHTLDQQTINKAYRIRSKQLHPDKHVRYPNDIQRAKTYTSLLNDSRDRLLAVIDLPVDRMTPQIDHWNHDAQVNPWINWPLNIEMPNQEIAHHLGEILQIGNGLAAVPDDADAVVPTNYSFASKLSREQKQWIKHHYQTVLVLFSSVTKGLNDYNEMLKEIFKFYNL